MRAALFYEPGLVGYRFRPGHPLDPVRLRLSLDLWQEAGILKPEDIRGYGPATDRELLLFHTPDYLAAMARASREGPFPGAEAFGLGTTDNPVVPGVDEGARLVVGSTLTAARALAAGRLEHALSLGGGLHHAHPNRASGFCLYNDLAVAIRFLRSLDLRVGYVDIDAHHADGVQEAFYEDPGVLTVSLHESGHTLFPGTGFVFETGRGAGEGYAVNIPLAAGTGDDSYLEAFRELALPYLESFHPDILVSQCGADAHRWDPLSHLELSLESYRIIFAELHRLAHRLGHGRWLATGGGGYDPYRVVPRVWGLLWAEMTERPLPPHLPEAWRERWRGRSPFPLPDSWSEEPSAENPLAREENRRTLAELRRIARPF